MPLVMQLEKIVAERAKANQGTRTDLHGNLSQNSVKSADTQKQMAALAGVKYRTEYVSGIEDEESAKTWLIDNQLGRRNLPRQAQTLLLGMKHERRKKGVGEHAGNQHTKLEKGKSCPFPTTAETVAREEGVHPNPIKNRHPPHRARVKHLVRILTKCWTRLPEQRGGDRTSKQGKLPSLRERLLYQFKAGERGKSKRSMAYTAFKAL